MTKHYRTFLFDLDGTLTDPQVGITNSIQYALARFGIMERDRKGLIKFIGPPLLESFRKWYGFDDTRGRKAIAFYREYYAEQGIYENTMYEGIDDLLSELHSRGCMIALATSKATIYAQKILEHFGIAQYFDRVEGSNFDLTRAAKFEIIADILAETSARDRDEYLMVGDHVDDIRGARENGIDSVAATYGYGLERDLVEAGPTHIVHTVQELRTLLLKSSQG
ncbi:MAG: HAD hydrolase-like protein [candidate division WOR-3 bacterium]|nr:HAD hydrolase-like protein [candidate division WOR-3 bacterium]